MRQNIIILVTGITLIFLSLFLFTRPAIFESWNFSDTGQIGDTIGGITAPIINLIGAFLVYNSFKAQIAANKIQVAALEEEKLKNQISRVFENHLSLFDEIKNRLKDLEFIVEIKPIMNPDGSATNPSYIIFKGINALNEYVLRIESDKENPRYFMNQTYSTYGQFLNFHFMLSALLDLLERIDINVKDEHDKEYLENIAKRFYSIFLKDFSERIIKVYSESGIEELIITKEKIDLKCGV
jgi:hypothetical protein